MAFYQRASKLTSAPAGAAAATSLTSVLLGGLGGRCRATAAAPSATAHRKLHRMAGQTCNAVAKRTTATAAFPSRATAAGHLRRTLAPSGSGGASPFSSSSGAAAAEGVGSSSGGRRGFVEWYEGHLASRPVATKAATGAFLWGLGDAVAQSVPPLFFSEKEVSDAADGDAATATRSVAKREFEYDVPRTARAVAFGFALHAPLSHLHFNFLEWMTVRGGFQGLGIPVFKTIMEQFVYWSWISNSLYHGAMGAMQGMNATQIYDRISDVLWDTQVAQWAFWIPVQLLNFRFVPVRHQLNVVLLTSVAWTALLSAWYPPEEEEENVEAENQKKE